MPGAYYNEFDPYAAQWLRNLIAAGHIAPGDVDERSIEDVHPDDLKHYTQCHFFAGIGVWSLALRRAGWPDDRPVWTGSCPCQPFSSAGQGAGFDDPRHLWPSWAWLINKLRPATIFGEQVARAPDWIRLVRGDLVAMGYAVGESLSKPHAQIRTALANDFSLWRTPMASDGKKADCRLPGVLRRIKEGKQISLAMQARLALSNASMESVGRLSPEHSRWLMNIPIEWSFCAPTETPSMLKRRRSS